MKVVILAGGKGKRLSNYTVEIPKPMVKINNKPILLYQIESLKKYGLIDIIISIGYLGTVIKDYFGDGKDFGIKIEYIEELEELGTGGALSLLSNKIKDDFILLFGDLVFDIDWDRFIKFYYAKKTIGVFLAHPNSHPYDSDLLIIDDNYIVKRISYKKEKRDFYYRNIVKSGIHILNKQIFNYIDINKKQDFEKDIIKNALDNNEIIYAYKTTEYVKDMGTYDRLSEVENAIALGILGERALYNKRKCIFLDRDGTINKYNGLVCKPEEFELEDYVAEAIRNINKRGYLCVVITNQPVISRGMCDLDGLNNIHNKMETLLGEKGAYIDAIYYCPHHPDKGYLEEISELKIECSCRKPKTGLLEKASSEYNIDLDKSLFIGDTTTDIMTGKNFGISTILLRTGLGGTDNKFNIKPDFIFDNLLEAINKICI